MSLLSGFFAGGIGASFGSNDTENLTLQGFMTGALLGVVASGLLFAVLRALMLWLHGRATPHSGIEALSVASGEKQRQAEEQPKVKSAAEQMAQEGAMAATEQTWGARAAERQETERKLTAWTDSPLIKSTYINRLISGSANIGWFEWVVTKYLPDSVERALNIGCGDGSLERHGIYINAAKHFDAFDVSQGAIDVANSRAKAGCYATRVNYSVTDLNRHVLPASHYDVVFASQSLHHIANLEHLFKQVSHTLKPGGLFIVNEFVGANQFQWPSEQIDVAQTLLETIPKRLRMGILNGELKEQVERPTIEMMNIVDPTEAIRSEELMEKFAEYFEVIEQRDFGGTYLNLVLENIVGNFDEDKPEDRRVMEGLCTKEQELLRELDVPSDFTVVVMRRKS